MAKFTSPLDNVSVASPCSQDWDAMIGDQRKRYCGECKLNVYNLSGMTRIEAENLIVSSGGRLCVRFFKRADGTILTEDCPVGWQAVKRRVSRTAAAAFSLLVGLVGGLGFTSALTQTKKAGLLAFLTTPTPQVLMGAVAETTPTPKSTPKSRPEPLMGLMAVPTPKTTPRQTPKQTPEMVVGKISVSKY